MSAPVPAQLQLFEGCRVIDPGKGYCAMPVAAYKRGYPLCQQCAERMASVHGREAFQWLRQSKGA